MLSNDYATIIPWQDPFNLAENIANNYNEDWVFLYSGIKNDDDNKSIDNSSSLKSYIAIFANTKFSGKNFEEFINIVKKSDNEMWFGGFGYELCSQFEDVNLSNDEFISLPFIFFNNYNLVLEFNHNLKKLTAYTKNYDLINKIFNLRESINNKTNISVVKLNSNFTDSSYKNAINQVKNHIINGDFFQANLTRKFFGNLNIAPNNSQSFKIFKELCQKSPANYASFFAFDNNFIISSSPELFLKTYDDIIISRPIKGSIKRGKDNYEDEKLKNYLQNSSKELAENLMIVDLMRNDFARFCEVNNVKVDKLFKLDSFATIHHLSSEISGKIDKNFSIFDAIKFCFPPGSMTGAPKIKVIQILNEIEKIRRGIYSGSLGFISRNQLNLSVVIRTLVINGNKFEFQVGGGITFDSNPDDELDEIYVKAKAIASVLGIENFN